MDFQFSEETTLIRNSAREFLKEKCPSDFVREMARDDTGFSKRMYKEMAELGWLGMLYDEAYGGSGNIAGSFFDLFVILEEIGKVLLPSPFFTSAVMSGMIIDYAGDAKLKGDNLPEVIGGKKILTTALLNEKGKCDAEAPELKAMRNGNEGYALTGTRLLAPYAHVANGILVCANVLEDGGPTLFKIGAKADGLKQTALGTLTGEKTFALEFEGVPASAGDIIGGVGQGAACINAVLPKAMVLKCAEMLGGMEYIVDTTVGYVKERKQFGAPLGTLQVIHHYCADMTTLLETSRLLARQAAYLISKGMACDKEAAAAKAWLSDGYKKCTWTAQQLHGGIGFTEEYDIQLYYKHAKECELAFGDSRFQRSKVADAMGI
jgi:alkylation response protein AidB-like acyl-CoA dehydrogenase